MNYVIPILLTIVGLLVLFFLFGIWHLRQSAKQAVKAIAEIRVDEIEALAQECISVYAVKLGMTLQLDRDLEKVAEMLDDSFQDSYKLKEAFEKDGMYWHFAKPVGAFLGELICRHADGVWKAQIGSAPRVEIPLNDGTAETSPFEKVLKQSTTGTKGDLYAYILASTNLGNLADGAI